MGFFGWQFLTAQCYAIAKISYLRQNNSEPEGRKNISSMRQDHSRSRHRLVASDAADRAERDLGRFVCLYHLLAG
ncbi:hypothetical protein [Roseovarius marisflavi]|uniref:hypothetical protein n=1 Tax=Roseovarius marisflavi TaxID=1054996 RepID=UPI001114794B|nr:hypothetical protein [Roseovarius marisflavi]